jgi:hypothetical protein
MAQYEKVGALMVERACCPECTRAGRYSSKMQNGSCNDKTCPLYRVPVKAMRWAQLTAARATEAEKQVRQATSGAHVYADPAPRTYEAQEGLGLSLLSGNAELALQDLEFAAARVRGYLKRIKEKL